MRIICDQCARPITGTVKRVSGNFNLHPHCLADFAEDPNTSNASTLGRYSPVTAMVKWEQNALIGPCELVKA